MPQSVGATNDASNSGSGRIAILVSGLEPAGAERVAINLAEYLVQSNRQVDLVLVRKTGALLNNVPAGVRIVDLASQRALTAIGPFRRYLRSARPSAVISINFEVNLTAAAARIGLPAKPKLIMTVHAALQPVLAGAGRLVRLKTLWLSKLLYPTADWVVAVSKGAAEDLVSSGWSRKSRTVTIYNPIVRSDFDALANVPPDHPWLQDKGVPVILGLGRLVAQKDFDLLLRAFAIVRRRRPARLMIVGEGEEREALERRVAELGLAEDATLAGFRSNPFSFMRAADLFVLSSAFEGLPSTVIEAMAAGTPVVATDCPHGPRELLEGGRFGRLVPVGDEAALAEAICASLDDPITAGLRERARDFTLAATGSKYLELVDS